jgi:hypothetical protein
VAPVLHKEAGPDTEPAFQIGYRRSQIGGGIYEVVNQHVNLTSRNYRCQELARVGSLSQPVEILAPQSGHVEFAWQQR